MRLATAHTGDVVAIPSPGEPRRGQVPARRRGRFAVTPEPIPWMRERAAVTIHARAVPAHHRRRDRASAGDVGDLVLVDIRARRFHTRVSACLERGEFDGLTPNINSFHARPRDLQTRSTENAK